MNINTLINETYKNNPLLRNILIKPKTEEELDAEFDKKYQNGDFDDQMILDDDLPDFKDKWISEQNDNS